MHSETAQPSWSGRLTDGATARSESVLVRLTTEGLAITDLSGKLQTIPYDELGSASPLTGSSVDVLLTFREQPGATLFVSAFDFVEALAERTPSLSAVAQRWKSIRIIFAGIAAIAGLIGALWLLDVSPAKSIASIMPDSVRQRLGESVIASMAGGRRVCNSPAGKAALDKLVGRLSDASASRHVFRVRVVEWKLLNAFATPGEQIVLTSEIVEKAQSSDEVAGVLAHEMGHGIELHPEAGLVRTIGIAAALEIMIGGGTLSNIGLTLAQIQYTRVGEREADRQALRILKAASISSRGLVGFFERLAGKEGPAKDSVPLAILRTHPFSKDRAREASERPAYPSTPALSAADWLALKGICAK